MSRRRNAIPTQTLTLPLGAGLAVDLEAFCNSNRGQPAKVRIIREAIKEYIDSAIRNDAALAERFVAAKADIHARMDAGSSIRAIRSVEKDTV